MDLSHAYLTVASTGSRECGRLKSKKERASREGGTRQEKLDSLAGPPWIPRPCVAALAVRLPVEELGVYILHTLP